MDRMFLESELILNPDGSIYHLNLLPEDLADTIITVGDPDRVKEVSKHFDSIELKKQKREFVTHTGYLGKKRVSVVSSGIGADNIDIVLNELDLLANVDFTTRAVKKNIKQLDIIRIGTSGALQKEIPLDSILVSKGAFGFDFSKKFYPSTINSEEEKRQQAFQQQLSPYPFLSPYYAPASPKLLALFPDGMRGITATMSGFYAPQGRPTRLNPENNLLELLKSFKQDGQKISNLEMETAAIYALSAHFGHQACSVSAILANRANGSFSSHPQKTVSMTIEYVLDKL